LTIAIAIAMALLAGAIGFFLVGEKESGEARADKDATTETAATAASAQVTPTEPKLRIEPNWTPHSPQGILLMHANLPIGYTSATSQPNGNWVARLAVATSRISGRPTTFLLAVAVVLVWAITGPLFGFSDTWQLVINTGTTIVTFLMVFLIQATQNRDTLALQLKLDELILATKNARNQIAGIEEASDEEIEKAKVELLERAG
jgi:low affinity Fe/Cu permease